MRIRGDEAPGQLIRWKVSKLNWLDGRGERICLIVLMDSATSRVQAQFARHNSCDENLRLLWTYVRQWGRPIRMETDCSTLFRGNPGPITDKNEDGQSQIRLVLQQLDIDWKPLRSMAEVERFFRVAVDLLIPGLRTAKAKTVEEANLYLEGTYLPMWNRAFTRTADVPDAHRPLRTCQTWATTTRRVVTRRVSRDYRLMYQGVTYLIPHGETLRAILGADVEVEERLDNTLRARWQGRNLKLEPCGEPASQPISRKQLPKPPARGRRANKAWMEHFFDWQAPPLWTALK